MATTAGALTKVSNTDTQAVVSSAVATAGTAPYTYQWYRADATGFTPSSGNSIAGATALTLTDTGLTPGTVYFYKVVALDDSATPVAGTSTSLSVTMDAAAPNPNQFAEAAFLGMSDLKFNYNTISVRFDPAGSGTLVGGQAVKWATGASAIPLVVPCTAAADVAAGFVNYNIKDVQYVPGEMLEISMSGNVIFLRAVAAINRGVQVTSLPAAAANGTNGGVKAVTGSSGLPIVGYALDTIAQGALGRIFLSTPAYDVD